MGEDINGDGIGEPVAEWKKPNVGKTYPVATPGTTDEFDSETPGMQWQWHANPAEKWYSLTEAPGFLRLFGVKNPTQNGSLWRVPNLLLQKFPAPSFQVTTHIKFKPGLIGERSGLLIMGREWAYLALVETDAGLELGMYTGTYFQGYDKTEKIESLPLNQDSCYLRVKVAGEALCSLVFQ